MNSIEWDQKIGNHLADLRFYGDWMARHGRSIQRVIQLLPMRPAWEAMARESLIDAERELLIALAVVRAAKDQYDSLPIEISEAAE